MEPIFNYFTLILLVSILLIFYTYVIFPAILGLLINVKKINPVAFNMEFPGVTIIIPAYNEEKVIAEKLNSIIQSDYPKEKIEILIGSDASDDRTVEIVKTFAKDYSYIKLHEFSTRKGKPAVVNELVPMSNFNFIIFTDANVFFERQMIRKLAGHFTNEKTGLVGANILNVGMKKDGISIQEKSYIERENLIKYREGILWGCMMGPFGGCFAIRKELYENVPAGFLVDDFFISMKVIEKKFNCMNAMEAICYEDVSNDIRQEYQRKSRISAGNFQNLKMFSHFLLRPFSPAGFCFISHKFFRWMTPFLIILSLIALSVLSFSNIIYLVLLTGELLLLISPLIDWLAGRMGFHLRFLRFVSYFSYMNLALLRGFFSFLGGIQSGVWTPTKRG